MLRWQAGSAYRERIVVTERSFDVVNGAKAASLLDILTPIVMRALAVLEGLRGAGPQPPPAAEVRKELFEGLRRARDSGVRAGRPEAEVYHAIFAVAAWADDRLSRHPAWYRDTQPLTATLFKSKAPAAEFGERLNGLTDAQAEAREVFVVVLGLGFGSTPDDPARTAQIARLKASHAARLRVPAPAAFERQPLAADLYASPDPPPRPPQPRRSPWPWAAAAAAVLVLAVGGGIAAWRLAPATPDGGDGEAAGSAGIVDRIVAGYDCARVDATLTGDGGVVLSGFVQTEADRDRLRIQVAAVDGVAGVTGELAVRPWPFCEAIGILHDHASPEAGDSRPTIALNADSATYRTGEPLVVTVTASPEFDGYLYVDYIDRQGGVLHLLPEDRTPRNDVLAGDPVVIGTESEPGPGERQWIVARPTGIKMIVALSSPVPLFDDLRPEAETAGGYLADLEESLAELGRLGAGDLPVAYTFLETVETDPAAD
jgi:type VI protein secretion system component VasF